MNRKYRKAFVKQRDQSDCGAACMASVIRYYGGDCSVEKIREVSGTNAQGTTLLGLYQSAPQLGLDAEAFEADISHLQELAAPCILHVLINERLQHYVICYGYGNSHFIISDPSEGVKRLTAEELAKIWVSRTLLVLKPAENFVIASYVKKEKRDWFKSLVKEDYNLLGTSLVLGIAISILALSTAVFSQRLIDDILPGKKTQKLMVGLALLFFLLLVKSLLGYIRQHFLNKQGQRFNNRVTGFFYDKLLYLPKSFFDTRKTGDLVARLNDTVRIQNAISYIGSSLMIDVLMIAVASVFIFGYSSVSGWIALASLPLYAVTVYMFHDKILDSQRRLMNAYALNESNYVDTIQGAGVIKVNNRQEFFSSKTRKVYGFFQETLLQLGTVRIKFNLITDVIASVLLALIITKGSQDVLHGNMKLGGFMAIIQMAGIVIPAAGRLAITNIQLQEAKVAFDRMYEYISIAPEYDKEDKNKRSVEVFEKLEVKNLVFRFPGRKPLLQDVSFSVSRGQMIALLGESGCGKSTTMQILQKFYHCESGSITVNDTDWNDLSAQSWRNVIAVVPQEIKVFSGTILDNICMGEGITSAQQIVTFCREYGFDNFFERLPQHYLTMVGEEGVALSGGQKQLLALARALYKKPQLLLLDEATAAMDRTTEAFILDMLKRIRHQTAIIMVTHKVRTAQGCDHIYVIENGKTELAGKHEELIGYENLYSEFWKQ